MGSQNANQVRIAVGASVVFGLLLLLASSLFVDDWREWNDLCNKVPGSKPAICKTYQYFVVGGAMGIVAALVQIASAALAFIGKEKGWSMAQILVVLLIIIAFAVPTSEDAFKIDRILGSYRSRALFFLSWCIIDAIFAVVSMLFVFKSSS